MFNLSIFIDLLLAIAKNTNFAFFPLNLQNLDFPPNINTNYFN